MTIEEMAKEAGYNGCRNCKHQIEPMRMCKWAESGGDGKIHLVCPYWQLKD